MNPANRAPHAPTGHAAGAAVMRHQENAPGWNPDRAGIESAAHVLINEVIAAYTTAMHRHTATGDTDRVRALTELRHATAQLRNTITNTSTENLTAALASLRATAEQLRADPA